ncbi:MAG TPA: hypothetical protein VN893_15105 [Bryobacteraceae bacterium]|nr:hypothetical protein [Bryobacteraceae bacterium]
MSKETSIEKTGERPAQVLERARLERELAEGYTANAAQARSAAEEFAQVDSDVIS